MTQDQIDSITELTNHLIAKDSIIASLRDETASLKARILKLVCYCDQCTGKAPVSGIHVFQGLPIPDSVKME